MPPPTPKAPKKISFPAYITRDLANGLRVLIIEDHDQPIVSFRFVIKTGSTADGELPGLASVTAELLAKGTKNRLAAQIADEIDYVGGQLVSGSNWDATFVSVSTLSKHLDVALPILADVALNPTFAVDEMERVREQRLAALLQNKDDAGYLAETKLNEAIFRGHPYSKPNIGTEQSIKALKREDVNRFHKNSFLPNSALLAVVGDVTPATILPRIDSVFGGWRREPFRDNSVAVPEAIDGRKVYVVDKPEAVQSAIRIGHLGISRNSEALIPAVVLNTILGGYFNSRLNLNLREAKGYTYGAQTTFDMRKSRGPFVACADVRNAVTDSAVGEILFELERIGKEPVSSEEIDLAKSFLIGSFPLQLETPNQIASRVIELELYDLPRDFYDKFPQRVEKIIADDLLRVAKTYLQPDRAVIVASGNSREISSRLGRFGIVESFDADGNRLSF